MTQAQAVKLVMDCLKVLFYRDARSLNKVSIHQESNHSLCLLSYDDCYHGHIRYQAINWFWSILILNDFRLH